MKLIYPWSLPHCHNAQEITAAFSGCSCVKDWVIAESWSMEQCRVYCGSPISVLLVKLAQPFGGVVSGELTCYISLPFAPNLQYSAVSAVCMQFLADVATALAQLQH